MGIVSPGNSHGDSSSKHKYNLTLLLLSFILQSKGTSAVGVTKSEAEYWGGLGITFHNIKKYCLKIKY